MNVIESLRTRIENHSGIRPDPNLIKIRNIDDIVLNKRVRKLYDLQEKYNKKAIDVKSSSRGCFVVLLERVLYEKDLNFSEPVEIWRVSDFRRTSSHHQTEAFLFVSGEMLTNNFRKTREEVEGQIVFLNGLKILAGMTYNDFKNKFSSKKKRSMNRLSLALSVFREDDLIFIGKCVDYARCEFEYMKQGKCDEPVNLGRNALSNHLRQKGKKKRKSYCFLHQNSQIQEGGRMDLVMPIGSAVVTRVKPSFTYESAVYTYLNRNVFVNPKGFRKMKRIRKTKEKKDEQHAQNRHFFEVELPEKLSRGQQTIMFQKKKVEREKFEKIMRKKDSTASNLDIKKKAMEIVQSGGFAPKIARGVKRKRKMVFSLSDSDSEEEEEEGDSKEKKTDNIQPPKKKRKLD